jgi:hypothetical protein
MKAPFIEMRQACPTYNHFATHEYLLDRYFDANADGHDPSNLPQAHALAGGHHQDGARREVDVSGLRAPV